jgi:DNA-binding transcriptional MerR regulator
VKHYTTGDIAEALGVEPSTVRAYNAREQMPRPTGHVGRTPYWTPEDIEPWLREYRHEPTAASP